MMLRVWPVVLVVGCSQSALSALGDGGSNDLALAASNDLATGALPDLTASVPPDLAGGALPDLARGALPDLAGASCATISTAVQDYLNSNAGCRTTSDCAVTNTNCGLPGQCGAYVTQSALAGLMSLDQDWTGKGCTGACPPCAAPAPATCSNGQCTSLGFSDRPVGSPCGGDSECHTEGQYTGQCLLSAPFTNGDCVLPCAHGYGCPLSGMLCRPAPGMTAPGFCYETCTTDGDCRTGDGYRCCPQWSASVGMPGGVCYPSPCPT